MKIFICWSGARANTLAETIHRWLPNVVAGLEPFLSSHIEAGVPWLDRVSQALQEARAGLVCLTPESLDSSWIHFEAGALTHAVGGRLYVYSHHVPVVTDPLKQFQSTPTTHDGTLNLVKSIDRQMRGNADQAALIEAFEDRWPELSHVIASLNAVTIDRAVRGFGDLFTTKTFNEPMLDCLDRSWTGRLERLTRVDAILQDARRRVITLDAPHLLWMYDQVLEAIGRYTMNIRAIVLLTHDGEQIRPAEIPRDLLEGCEQPRVRILHLAQKLLDPSSVPVLEEAARFQGFDRVQRRDMTLAYEHRIAAGEVVLPLADRRRALDSFWDLDRIVSYQTLGAEATTAAKTQEIAQYVRSELERVEARSVRSSVIPLYCAVRVLDAAVARLSATGELAAAAGAILDVVSDVEDFVSADPDRDETGKVARRLEVIRASLGVARQV